MLVFILSTGNVINVRQADRYNVYADVWRPAGAAVGRLAFARLSSRASPTLPRPAFVATLSSSKPRLVKAWPILLPAPIRTRTPNRTAELEDAAASQAASPFETVPFVFSDLRLLHEFDETPDYSPEYNNRLNIPFTFKYPIYV